MGVEIKQCLLTENDCYKKGTKITPEGIVVHSSGANNPKLSRYIQPDDGVLGTNKYKNHWNRSGVSKCVHAMIGKDKDGNVRVYQTLPWDYRCWGCGKGKNGSYNDNYIQFEILEDALTDEKYFNESFALAIELCAWLCKEFGISVDKIVSHAEAHALGYASNHGDCDIWLKKFGKDMDWFRKKVEGVLYPPISTPTSGEKDKLKPDGKWGKDTTRKSQEVFGTTVDGIVSNQKLTCKTYVPNVSTNSWEFKLICTKGSSLIKAIQKFLKDKGYYTGKIDGWCGKGTVKAIQQFLKDLGYYTGKIDGKMGKQTVIAWQKYINSKL